MLYKMVLKKLIVANLVLITMGMWIHETYIKEFNQWFKRQSIVKNECDQHIVSENDLNKKQKKCSVPLMSRFWVRQFFLKNSCLI